MQKNIELFPNVNFIKTNDLVFSFNYKELFKVYDNRLFFMIILKILNFFLVVILDFWRYIFKKIYNVF